MSLKFFKTNFWLILIFVFALFLRTYGLKKYPEAIDEDEMSLDYIFANCLPKVRMSVAASFQYIFSQSEIANIFYIHVFNSLDI